MRKICLIAVALIASTAAHAEVSRGLIMTSAEAAPAPQPPAAVVQVSSGTCAGARHDDFPDHQSAGANGGEAA